MTDSDQVAVSYRVDPTWDLVVREVETAEVKNVEEIAASTAHSTLTKVQEAVEDHESNTGRVERVILGSEEYDQLLAYALLLQSEASELHLGGSQHPDDINPQQLVEDLVKKNISVVPGSKIQTIGSPNDQLMQTLREKVADE